MRTRGADRTEAEIVDLSLDPREARAEVRRRVVRIVMPFLAAFALAAAAFGAVAVNHLGNRADALRLAATVLDSLEMRIATEVSAWLGPAERVVRLLHGIYLAGAFRAESALATPLGKAVLASVPQVAIVSFGDVEGNYVMVRRNPEGGLDTKLIETAPRRRVVNTVGDASGAVLHVFEDPNDPFDPRTRPWFRGAVASDGIFWTEIYVFFTDRVPGLTVSIAVPPRDGRPAAVIGADIRLDALSAFLASLRIGTTGKAMIVDRAGRLVAFPEADKTIRQDGETLTPVRLDQIEDPVLTRAFDMMRLEGAGRRTMEIGGVRYLTVNTPLDHVVGREWMLLIVVPERELIGFVGRNSRIALAAASVVVGLALLLAAMLVRQGLRADRTLRQLTRRRRALAAQSEAFAAIAGDATLPDPLSPAGTHRLTEAVARVLGARRVGVWRFDTAGRVLACEDLYDASNALHTAATRLTRDEMPEAFAALAAAPIDTDDAANDARLASLHQLYLEPVGGRSLLSVPVRQGTETVGLLWVEDRSPEAEAALPFAIATAKLLTARLSRGAGAPPRGRDEARADGRSGTPRRIGTGARPGTGFLGRLAGRLGDPGRGATELFRDLTVLVVRFSDPAALAERAPDGTSGSLADQAVRTTQSLMERHGIAYLRVLGDLIVAADGFGGEPAEAARAVSDAALDLQDRLSALFNEADHRPAFRLGIDTGTAVGGVIGEGVQGYNLWGEVVQTATAMADTAPEGMIHVAESTYVLAADSVLVRPRGRFWLEGQGEMATFYLVARA